MGLFFFETLLCCLLGVLILLVFFGNPKGNQHDVSRFRIPMRIVKLPALKLTRGVICEKGCAKYSPVAAKASAGAPSPPGVAGPVGWVLQVGYLGQAGYVLRLLEA